MLPILYKSSGFVLFSYPLFMGLSCGLFYSLSKYYLAKTQIKFPYFRFYFWASFCAVWAGAKVLFLLVSAKGDAGLYAYSHNFWLGGGFVFLGGLLAALLFTTLLAFIKKIPLFHFTPFLPALCFSHALGRVGCFLTGCCYGKAYTGPLSVHMHGLDRYPIQLFEALFLAVLGYYFHRSLLMTKLSLKSSRLILEYIVLYSIGRFLLEFFRGDKIRGVYFNMLSTSQWISIGLLLILGVTYLIRKKYDTP